jgi:DNA-binding Lrp family transcriptional regulator
MVYLPEFGGMFLIPMPRAIVLVNADVGKETEVYSSIRGIPEVTEAYTSYGTYDIIAIVDAESNEKLKGIITSRIRSIPSIRSTLSMPVVD